MSYDVDLYRRAAPKCAHCGHKPEHEHVFGCDPTYNISGIVGYADQAAFKTEGRSFGAVHKQSGAASAKWFAGILEVLKSPEHADELHKLEPENGWGSLNSTIETFEDCLKAANENPDCFWRVLGDSDVAHDGDAAFFFGSDD